MNLIDVMRRTGGLSALTERVDLPPAQVSEAATTLLPFVLAGLRRVYEEYGPENAVMRLESLGGEELASNVLMPGEIVPSVGEVLLDFLFGSREASLKVGDAACSATGLELPQCKQVLSLLAMLIAGYLVSRASHDSAQLAKDLDACWTTHVDSDPLGAILRSHEN